MASAIKKVLAKPVKSVVGALGYRLVEWPEGGLTPRDVGHGTVPEFFPVGRVGPWTVPDDLRALPFPWARTLVSVYDDNGHWPASIVPEGGQLLQALVRCIQPSVIVETGTCVGVSTIWMASALAAIGKGHLWTYDDYRAAPDDRLAASKLFINRRQGVEDRLMLAGCAERVTIRVGDSAKAVIEDHEILRKAGGVQLAFIDGDHTLRGAAADFLAIEPVLAVGGYVILHDVFSDICNHVGPRMLLNELPTLAKGRYTQCDIFTAQTNYGMTLLQRIG
jgi:predicted O-methyltransferase YrrM